MNNKIYQKYSYYCEGECDKQILFLVKKLLLDSKYPLCKKHSKIANGTPRITEVPESLSCCKKIILIDEDRLSNTDINNFKIRYKNDNNSILVISYPSIECVLYSIFDVPDAILDKKNIERKLEKKLNEFKLKYNHDHKNLYSIIEWLKNNNDLKEKWFKNLNIIKEKKRSNFIDVIKFFEI